MELPVLDLDPPEADVLLRGIQGAGCLVDDDTLELRALAGLLARRPGRVVGKAERRGEVERVDLLVRHLPGHRGELEQADVGLVPSRTDRVRRAALRERGQSVDRLLLVDLRLVGRERQRDLGGGHVGEPSGAGVDGVRPDLVPSAIAGHGEVDRAPAELEAVHDVDVVEAACLVVRSRRRRCRDALQQLALEAVDVEPGVLGGADHDAARRVVAVDPDRRVVGVAVVAGIVVEDAGCLRRGSDADELVGGSRVRGRLGDDQRRDGEQRDGRECGLG